MAASAVTHVQYFVPLDGDSEEHPNVFLVRKAQRSLTLGDIAQSFPLPGSYIFRAKAPFGKTYVWLDLNGDDDVPPTFNGKILLKVARLSAAVNNQTAPARVQPAATTTRPQPSPEARPPSVPARAPASTPSEQALPAAAAAAPASHHQHDHDDPLGLFKGHQKPAAASSSAAAAATASAPPSSSSSSSASGSSSSSSGSNDSNGGVPADIFSGGVGGPSRASPAPPMGSASNNSGGGGGGFDAFWGMGGAGASGGAAGQPSPAAGRPSAALPLNAQRGLAGVGMGVTGSNPAANNSSKGNLLNGDIFNF